jgi:prepilin-type processing-associated H-X9-DG protein
MLFPVFARARAAAYQSSCTSNLRQIATGFALYFQDYDGTFPPNGVVQLTAVEDFQRLWNYQIQPYMKNNGVLHCPADNVRNAQRTLSNAIPSAFDRPDLPALSYGANWAMLGAATFGRPEARIAGVQYPAETLLVSDCTEPWAFGPIYTDDRGVRWSPIAYANGPPSNQAFTIASPHGGRAGMGHERHGDGSNIAYLDGHVHFLRADAFVSRPETREGHTVMVQRPILLPDGVPPDR